MATRWNYGRMIAGAAVLGLCASAGWAQQAAVVKVSQPITGSQAAGKTDAVALRNQADALLAGNEADAGPRAVALLQKASAAGDVASKTRLGKILLDGYYVPADPVVGRTLLQQAVAAGDHDAERILGSQLISGWVLPRDSGAGVALMQKAVAAGDDRAMVELGNYYLGGWAMPQDKPKALALFEQAAKAGNGAGLESYGTDLMWTRDNPEAAKGYLMRAIDLGQASSWATLAEGEMYGYLGKRSNAAFEHYADEARKSHVQRIAVVEAQRQMWGEGVPRSGRKALALLKKAADDGNRTAAIYLIGLRRDGNHYNIRKSTADARTYLHAYRTLLGPETAAQLKMTIDASNVHSVAGYEKYNRIFESHRTWHTDWFGKQLVSANKNLAVYIVQAKLRGGDVYGHTLNGHATRPTLVAMTMACRNFLNTDICHDGVILPDVMGPMMIRPVVMTSN